ncbi:MAG: hypothetical protein QF483_02215 [Gammaproteobacteria bacterium]|jgi:hypothetical protein|nr:hypothetical protein [Chromatiales bacterium]MCP4926896.1 hypothetical protein [Gammaproteobacteria bacterium]MDP7295869.1 hypothetical protein [Gammaproteobacteria bacterium]MDP7418679.1 hypothetical protein [Gammaproteobacteria bacterium]MDP7661208.1 hypothetical protein [Gammaproteobacteria bacterium]
MLAYVQAFINIALRRSGPEDLPDSSFMLWFTLVVYIATQVPIALITHGLNDVLARTVLVSLALLFGLLWLLLNVAGYRARYKRTVTAMLGTSALLSALSIPFSLWQQVTLEAGSMPAMPTIIIFLIMIWSVTIDGHILSRALSRPYAVGLLIAIGYFFLHTRILFALMPDGIGN